MATRKLLGATVALASVGFIASVQAGSAPLFSGVVQSVDLGAKQLVISGKRVSSKDAARVVAGQTVNVYGAFAADGTVQNATLESIASYASVGANNSSDAKKAAGVSIGGTEVEGVSIGGDQTEGVSIGGDQTEGVSIGGEQTEGVSIGGEHTEGVSIGGEHVEGVSIGGAETE